LERLNVKHRRTRLKDAFAVMSALGAALGLGACSLDQEGIVLLTDQRYRVNLIDARDAGFTLADGILWHDGTLVMADEGGHAVRTWSKEHGVKTLCDETLGIREPEDLVMDADGNIFFTDDTAGGVWAVDRTGKAFLLAGAKQGLGPAEGIAIAPWGDLLVGDAVQHRVLRVERSGDVSVFLGPEYGINKPESMVFDRDGNLYIADNEDNVVYLLTPKMKLRRLIEHVPGFSPETITYADRVLYITDSKNGKLSRFTREEGLETIAVFGGKLRYVCGVTTDPNGGIYVSIQGDLETGYVVHMEHDPRPRSVIAAGGRAASEATPARPRVQK
jgi:sugar lactone lactonase YvrE